MKKKPHSQGIVRGNKDPEHTDSDAMARAAREQVNAMTEEEVEEVEEHFKAAMARVYGGRPAQQSRSTISSAGTSLRSF